MDYIQYVNIRQGTQSTSRFSNGNTLPLVQRPFGFASFAPQTNSERGSWFYHPQDRSLEGIRLTHQPSPWIGEHGAIVIQPQLEMPRLPAWSRWSSFDPSKTVLEPGYMKYHLNRTRAVLEMTPTVHGGCFRIRFHSDLDRYLSVLPVSGLCGYRFDGETGRLYARTDCCTLGGHDKGRAITYFVFDFRQEDLDPDGTLIEDTENQRPGFAIEGENTGIHLRLRTKELIFSMASSYISFEQAERNLCLDSNYADFDDLCRKNREIWNECLSRIQIKASPDITKTFYSCLYRVFLFPHRAHEYGPDGTPIHYSPALDAVRPGLRYTDNGFWDTYRTVYPLLRLIAKDEYRDMLEGFLTDFIDGGWLPCWTAMDAKKCMPSTMIDAVLADAAANGMLPENLLTIALEGMEKHANLDSPIPAYGREGCGDYLKLGYVPGDRYSESVNLTLDAAYGDWCISVVANALGLTEKAERYAARARNYRHLFDPETGFMRAKKADGTFKENFDPFSWGGDYTESSAFPTSFSVPHDLEGLAQLHGGKEQLLRKLDELFAAPRDFRVGGYGFEIHEMSEMTAGSWGQCAISNQPSFHLPFIYAYFGETEKTSHWVERICREGFTWRDDGFPGDEDNGTMAAWYIFAALGLYPLCPGKKEFVTFRGIAEEARIVPA